MDIYLGFLDETTWTKQIDPLLQFLDEELATMDKRVIHLLEMTLAFFMRLGKTLTAKPCATQTPVYSKNTFLVQMLCVSHKIFLTTAIKLSALHYEINIAAGTENFSLYGNTIEKFIAVSLSKQNISHELMPSLDLVKQQNNIPTVLQHDTSLATYRNLFDIPPSDDVTPNKHRINVIATEMGHIAKHMSNSDLSEHLYSALITPSDDLEKKEEIAITLRWLAHYCFVLLRQGKLEKALEQLNILVNCTTMNTDPMVHASAARGLALYHFLCKRVGHAYNVLRSETLAAIKKGIPHAAFLDPINFDVLYVFEQHGYATIPRYELDATIEEVLAQSNSLLQGAALRIQAMRLRREGEKPEKIVNLLRAAKNMFHPERDVREIIITLHELANTLVFTGNYGEAKHIRKIITEYADTIIEPDTPYILVTLIATTASYAHIPEEELSPPVEEEFSTAFLPQQTFTEDGLHIKKEHEAFTTKQDVVPCAERNNVQATGDGISHIFAKMEKIAATDASVLLLGETGVGKEVVARHIHERSGRSGAFIAVHPASTSETLFESEFFGHERGAFTGATHQRKGLFEAADQGTLFIDEVGDIPPLMQTKLLRVLQERVFMRIGGNKLIGSNFRLITATNKDLRQEVLNGNFRADLFFRTAVVPVTIPPLRDRPQDIAPLLDAYKQHYCSRYEKKSPHFTNEHKQLLYNYSWPGNVRELKNVMELAVIQEEFTQEMLLFGNTENTPLQPTPTRTACEQKLFSHFPRLDELEKSYLQHVFKATKGRIRGEQGAAALLHCKVSTLYAKLKRHGIL